MNASSKIYKLADLISKDDQPCLFCTIGIDGKPRTRFMAGYRIRAQKQIILTTYSDSTKIHEIRKNPNVQFILFTTGQAKVLTLSCMAKIVDDLALRQEIYEERKRPALFPVFDDSYGVILLEPVVAEYLDVSVSNSPVVINIQ